jgi:hypothetical protein
LAARASGDAAGACSVSFNVAASLSKTVISPADLPVLYYVRAFGCQGSRAGAKEETEMRA